jgi:replicative DNA helicase
MFSMRSDNRAHELGQIAREFKSLAMSLKIPVMMLAQLNRGLENRSDKRPTLGDLRDSGELAENADMVAFLYRGEYYQPDDQSLKGKAEFIIRKQRNGETPIVHLAFNGPRFKFTEEDENERAVD